MSFDEDRDNHFVGLLGGAVEAARLGGLCVHVELEDGSSVEGVPEETPLAEGTQTTEIDHSGVRADLVLGSTVVTVTRVRRFSSTGPTCTSDLSRSISRSGRGGPTCRGRPGRADGRDDGGL